MECNEYQYELLIPQRLAELRAAAAHRALVVAVAARPTGAALGARFARALVSLLEGRRHPASSSMAPRLL